MSMKTHLICICIICIVSIIALGCIYEHEVYSVELQFAERSPWEHASGKRVWYTIRFLSEDGVSEIYLPAEKDSFTIQIPKGFPCIVAAYPLGQFAPLGVCVNPGNQQECRFELTSRAGDIAASILEYQHEFSDVIERIDYQSLVETIWIETEGRPWATDWGDLYFQILFGSDEELEVNMGKFYPVEIPHIQSGYWIADQRGVPVASASQSEGTAYLSLPQGEYHLYNPECSQYTICLTIATDGEYETEFIPVPSEL